MISLRVLAATSALVVLAGTVAQAGETQRPAQAAAAEPASSGQPRTPEPAGAGSPPPRPGLAAGRTGGATGASRAVAQRAADCSAAQPTGLAGQEGRQDEGCNGVAQPAEAAFDDGRLHEERVVHRDIAARGAGCADGRDCDDAGSDVPTPSADAVVRSTVNENCAVKSAAGDCDSLF